MIIVISCFVVVLCIFIIGYSVGHTDGLKDGYSKCDDEYRMRCRKKGIR